MHIHLIGRTNTGYKPFKFFNCWQLGTGFQIILTEAWTVPVEGSALFQFVRKLKTANQALKEWRKQIFEWPSVRIQHLREQLKRVHEKLGNDPINIQLQKEELELQEVGTWLTNEASQIRQKSTVSWMHLGDKNTRFFYYVIKAKPARNHINHLMNDGGKLTLISIVSKQNIQSILSSYLMSLLIGMCFLN